MVDLSGTQTARGSLQILFVTVAAFQLRTLTLHPTDCNVLLNSLSVN